VPKHSGVSVYKDLNHCFLAAFCTLGSANMKRTFLVLIAFICLENSYSQTTDSDSIIVLQSRAGRLSGLIDIQDLVSEGYNYWNEDFEGHWAGIELGINGFSNPDYSMYSASENGFLDNDLFRSNVLNLNILQYSKGIQQNRNNIGLVAGIGLCLQSYRLDNKTTISTDQDLKIFPETQFYEANQKSKLSSVYLEVPLLIEFQIPIGHSANRIYFSTGLTGAKRLETHTKVKYRKNGKREKLKSPGDYSIQDYKVAATFRIGYRSVNLFTTYDLVPLFDDRKGPVLYPFSFGVKLISF